jgi:hypothetical protein
MYQFQHHVHIGLKDPIRSKKKKRNLETFFCRVN